MATALAGEAADRRSARTREAVLHAFLDLLFERGYESLGVGDIVAKANIGRSTFYEHFAGKDDVLRFSLRRPFSVLADIIGADDVSERTVKLLVHFRERRRLGPALFSWPVRPLLTRALADLVEPKLAQPAARGALGRRVVAVHIAEAQLALVDQWIVGRIPCRIEAMAAGLHASTNAIVRALH
jgi:AcrR family transcriptional regulator